MKLLYSILKLGNYWFTIYYIHYKDKLEIKKLIYNFCFYYSFSIFNILEIQTSNILILANINFASRKKVVIKFARIITKDWEYFIFLQILKFYKAKIKLDLKRIILIKESYIGNILLITNYDIDSINSRAIIWKKLLLKEEYLAQSARNAYIAFIYHLNTFLNLFWAI